MQVGVEVRQGLQHVQRQRLQVDAFLVGDAVAGLADGRSEGIPAVLPLVTQGKVVRIQAVDIVDEAELQPQPAVHGLGVGDRYIHPPSRLQEGAIALQYQIRVVDVLQDEAHDNNVELVLRREILEVGFDDPTLEIGRTLPELLDHHAGPVDNDVVVGCLGKNPRGIAVAQPQLQQ